MKILIAGDNLSDAMTLSSLLAPTDEIIGAGDGEQAWQLLRNQAFDVVISDRSLPNVDGLELCSRLRGEPGSEYIYFILLLESGQGDERLNGLQMGADEALVMPVTDEEMAARLEIARRVLSKREALQLQAAQLSDELTYLKQANHRLTDLFMESPIACFTYNEAGLVQEWNRRCESLFGLRGEQAILKKIWSEICRPLDKRKVQGMVKGVFAGNSYQNQEWAYLHPDGTTHFLLCSIYPLRGADGSVVGAASAHVDITERELLEQKVAEQLIESTQLNIVLEQEREHLEQANARLAEMAATDSLTGLANRRHLMEVLETTFAIAKCHDQAFSLIMVDVDRFKQFNDTYGHLAGDDVLKAVADILQLKVRREDIVARYGGEEFVLLLPITHAHGAKEVAERLRSAIEKYDWPQHPITVSLGIATTYEETENATSMIAEADQALYYSKSSGRNRVTHFLDIARQNENEKEKAA